MLLALKDNEYDKFVGYCDGFLITFLDIFLHFNCYPIVDRPFVPTFRAKYFI